MKKVAATCVLAFALLGLCATQILAQECSTEKINNKTCWVTVDRAYPVVIPTIQMRPGKPIKVRIKHPLPFEGLSLDLQTAQAVAGTDQTAGFVTAALPNLKGLLLRTQIDTSKVGYIMAVDGAELPSITRYKTHLTLLENQLKRYGADAATVYAQINEVLGPIPPQILPTGLRPESSLVSQEVPRPWVSSEYLAWRSWVLCEIGGEIQGIECPDAIGEDQPDAYALLADGTKLINSLAPCPNPPVPPNALNSQPIACDAIAIQQEVGGMSIADQRTIAPFLQSLNVDAAVLNADSAAVTTINKDLGTYWANVERSAVISPPEPLAEIVDPFDTGRDINVQLATFLGRQVVFSVNSVNEIGTFIVSVTPAAQKKTIATITIVYANPIFEVSTGAFFSTLANRSFANQTIVTQNPNAPPTLGNVVISQTITRPTIEPFVGANWRISPEVAWWDHRRKALYLTAALGLNPNNTTTEFGAGLSFSWRSLMFSTLSHWGHDVRLTQGETVGEVWCNQTAATGSIPKCSGNPPSPTSEKYWRTSFAFGISIRVPTVFGGKT